MRLLHNSVLLLRIFSKISVVFFRRRLATSDDLVSHCSGVRCLIGASVPQHPALIADFFKLKAMALSINSSSTLVTPRLRVRKNPQPRFSALAAFAIRHLQVDSPYVQVGVRENPRAVQWLQRSYNKLPTNRFFIKILEKFQAQTISKS